MDFEKELEMLINKHSKENESDTPDFVLAQYLKGFLTNYAKTVGCAMFETGFYCALAKVLLSEGIVTPTIKELFLCGGDWTNADLEDIKVFQDYGLINK